MAKKLKPIPRFKTETEERKFWETHDSTDYIDWSRAERARFQNLTEAAALLKILALGERQIAEGKTLRVADAFRKIRRKKTSR